MQQVTGIGSYQTVGSTLDISYMPTVTWQDTTSNATYMSVGDAMGGNAY